MPYYSERLAAERLQRCYEVAPAEVRRYLEAEVRYLLAATPPGARVLELGCGYGRVLARLGERTDRLVGIDLSLASLVHARRFRGGAHLALACCDAAVPALRAAAFDLVCCPQNGISAFHVDQRALIESAVGLTAPGGRAVFFSYADEFWPHRLAWFRIQARHGLVGEIDEAATGEGTIVCRDGFVATTVSPERFLELTRDIGGSAAISVLGGSSVVCSIAVPRSS